MNPKPWARTIMWCVVTPIMAAGLFLLVRHLYLRAFEVKRLTPFSVSVETTSVAFSTAGNASDDPGSVQRGLLASDSTVNLDVGGCSNLERTDVSDHKPIGCGDETLSITNVQLSHLTLAAGTEIRLWVLDNAVHMKISRPTADSDFELRITSSKDSAILTSHDNRPRAGEWRILPSGSIMTLVLSDGYKSRLDVEEQEQPLTSGSGVHFRSDQGNALLGTGSLVLPQLPKDLEEIKLGKGSFSIGNLQTGVLRQLSISREANRMRSLHVELTGLSDDLLVYDTYSTQERNEALTWFDANSGKDRRLKVLTLCVLLLGGLSVFSTATSVVSNLSQIRVNRSQIAINKRNTLTQKGDQDLVRVAEALERSNELRVSSQTSSLQAPYSATPNPSSQPAQPLSDLEP